MKNLLCKSNDSDSYEDEVIQFIDWGDNKVKRMQFSEDLEYNEPISTDVFNKLIVTRILLPFEG